MRPSEINVQYRGGYRGPYIDIRTLIEKRVKLTVIDCFHDTSWGTLRGKNKIHILDWDGYKLVHMGDLGSMLTSYGQGLDVPERCTPSR